MQELNEYLASIDQEELYELLEEYYEEWIDKTTFGKKEMNIINLISKGDIDENEAKESKGDEIINNNNINNTFKDSDFIRNSNSRSRRRNACNNDTIKNIIGSLPHNSDGPKKLNLLDDQSISDNSNLSIRDSLIKNKNNTTSKSRKNFIMNTSNKSVNSLTGNPNNTNTSINELLLIRRKSKYPSNTNSANAQNPKTSEKKISKREQKLKGLVRKLLYVLKVKATDSGKYNTNTMHEDMMATHHEPKNIINPIMARNTNAGESSLSLNFGSIYNELKEGDAGPKSISNNSSNNRLDINKGLLNIKDDMDELRRMTKIKSRKKSVILSPTLESKLVLDNVKSRPQNSSRTIASPANNQNNANNNVNNDTTRPTNRSPIKNNKSEEPSILNKTQTHNKKEIDINDRHISINVFATTQNYNNSFIIVNPPPGDETKFNREFIKNNIGDIVNVKNNNSNKEKNTPKKDDNSPKNPHNISDGNSGKKFSTFMKTNFDNSMYEQFTLNQSNELPPYKARLNTEISKKLNQHLTDNPIIDKEISRQFKKIDRVYYVLKLLSARKIL
jgi:hypothetical protein